MFSGHESVIAGEVLNSGRFLTVDRDHETTGTVEILQKENRIYVRLGMDFSTTEGPDVYLLLHEKNPPIGYDQADYLPISRLRSFNGTQVYQVPEGVALDQYVSVVVWCKEFNIVFGAAHVEELAETVGAVNPELALSYSR